MSDIINNELENEKEEYSPDIVSVIDDDGEEHIFEELDVLSLDDKEYVALLPIYEEDDVTDDGELIILLRNYDDDGEIYLEPIENEAEFMRVGKIFEERLSDMFDFDD